MPQLHRLKPGLQTPLASLAKLETTVWNTTTLNDPEFHAARSREAHGLIADLEAAKGEVERLYERWQ